jgi:dolichol-phosphate mannosyltransferase
MPLRLSDSPLIRKQIVLRPGTAYTAEIRRDLMDLSVVIPVKNEAANIAPLVAEIREALDGLLNYEIVYVDDGSEDPTVAEVVRLQAETQHLRLLRHARSCGQSAAIRTGVRAARAVWIATLDGDGQNDPADILELWRIGVTAPTTPSLLIAGHREDRQDSWTKRTASQIANRIRRRLLVDDTPDAGCGLKLFPRSLFLDLPYFDHMHRFLPALVLREGGIVRSVRVNHRPRRRGVSKYGIFDRLGVGVVDLFGMIWLKRRAARPYLLDEVLLDSQPTSTPDRISAVR